MNTTPPIDLSQAQVFHPRDLSARENRAVGMLLDEVAKRTRIHWKRTSERPAAGNPAIALVPGRSMPAFAPQLQIDERPVAPEGFHVRTDCEQPAV